MVSVLSSSEVERWCEPRSDNTEDYIIGMCSFSAKHATLRKNCLARNQYNVSEWGDMYIRMLLS